MQAELYLSSPASHTGSTTINLKVVALKDAPNTVIRIEMPSALSVDPVEWKEDIGKGEMRIYQTSLSPLPYGRHVINATAISTQDGYRFGATAHLYVDVRPDGATASAEAPAPEDHADQQRSESIAVVQTDATAASTDDGKGTARGHPAVALAPGAGQIVVRGYWYYRDKNGIDRPLRDARVEVWDADNITFNDLLATVHTDNTGYYETAALTNTGDEFSTQDVFVKVFTTDDFSVHVTNLAGTLYSSTTVEKDNVPDGYVDFGGVSVTDTNNRMAEYIYDKIANDAYDYLKINANWTNSYNVQVRWEPNSTTGTYYSSGGSIDLVGGDRWDQDVFLHEFGHFVMYKIYGDTLPSAPNCHPHGWDVESSLGCAWVEGWANFLQAAIQNDRNYEDTEDQVLNIDYEPPTPAATHAEAEGAVAASMWDIYDSGTENWDSISNGINGIWPVVSGNRPNDVIGFYQKWMSSANGLNSQVTSILQHHDVIPNPAISASLSLTPGTPHTVGQTVTGKFSITNRGNRSITFDVLTVGGRLNDTTVADFPSQTNVTLAANQTIQYSGNFTFNQTGTYKFFPAYRLLGDVWRISLLNEIPADSGVVTNVSFSVATSTIPVTVQTSPSGRSFTVDGTNYTSVQTFNWSPGSSHSIGTTSTQSGGTGTQYVWSSWSDGGGLSHSVSPSSSATYTATFGTQYFLTMNAGSGGTVSPASAYFNSGQSVNISALPNSGFRLNVWSGGGSGSYSGSSNPASVTMNGPITETASFSSVSVPAPAVTTNAASGVSQTAATLNGAVNPNGSSTTTAFDYGTTTSYGNSVSGQTYSDSVSHSIFANASNLACGTTYHFRVRGTNGGGTTFGDDSVFTTTACSGSQAPAVSTGSATAVDQTNSTLNGTVNANGSQTQITWDYGTTQSYGSTAPAGLVNGTGASSVSTTVRNLLCATLYHYRIEATNAGGTNFGSDATFTTQQCSQTDTVPDAFAFASQQDVPLNTVVTSELVTITGINAPAPVTISGGSFSIAGAAFAPTQTFITNGQTLAVRVGSSSQYGTTTSALVNVGGVVSSFDVTTMACAPHITTQPRGTTIAPGETATLSVGAAGAPTLSYFWYRVTPTGSALVTQGDNLTAISVSPAQTTDYFVVINNECGTVTSNAATVVVCAKPAITSQPQNRIIQPGQSTTLSVAATGSATLSYFWYRVTATGSALVTQGDNLSTITVAPSQTTDYFVTVTNGCGSVLSNAATVKVCTPPVITTQPQSKIIAPGQPTTLSVAATGTATLSYFWYRVTPTGSALVTQGDNLTSIAVAPTQTTDYFVTVSNGCGLVGSNAATVMVCTPPAITSQPLSRTISPGQTTTLSVAATGTATLSYLWYRVSATGSVLLTQGDNLTSIQVAPTETTDYFVAVSNACGNVLSNAVTVKVCTPPVITAHPQSKIIAPAQPTTLSVAATGTATLTYFWYRMTGAGPVLVTQGDNLTSIAVAPTQTTDYYVTVSNSCGSVFSNTATITVCTLPVMTTQPQSKTIAPGQTTTLSAGASGTATLSYFWYRISPSGSVLIAQGDNLTSITVAPSQTTDYFVSIANACGSVLSNAATVRVCSPPAIVTQPLSNIISPGQQTTLSVGVTGSATLSYFWYRVNGAGSVLVTQGDNLSSIAVAPTQTTDYFVTITNGCGTVTSNVARVTVCSPPAITAQPQSKIVAPGQTTNLSVTATGSATLSYFWYRVTPTGSAAVAQGDNLSTISVAPTQTTDYFVSIVNACGVVTSNAATIAVCTPPAIPVQPQNRIIGVGQSATISIPAIGTTPLSYFWYRLTPSGSVLFAQGDNLSSITVAPSQTTDYFAWIYNACGGTISNSVRVTVCVPPAITAQPQNTTIAPGQSTTLSATATGTATLSYFWYRVTPTGSALVTQGDNLSTITVAPTQTTDYFVSVVNSCGSLISNAATVTVCSPPAITSQPPNKTISSGQSTTLSVTATGSATLSYFWYRVTPTGSAYITQGDNLSSISVTPSQTTDYFVWIFNGCGAVESNAAKVTVN